MSLSTSPSSANKRVQREIVRSIQARNGAGGVVLLRPGSVIQGFQIVRSQEPDGFAYAARFTYEGGDFACALHAFLPRTRVLENASPE